MVANYLKVKKYIILVGLLYFIGQYIKFAICIRISASLAHLISGMRILLFVGFESGCISFSTFCYLHYNFLHYPAAVCVLFSGANSVFCLIINKLYSTVYFHIGRFSASLCQLTERIPHSLNINLV